MQLCVYSFIGPSQQHPLNCIRNAGVHHSRAIHSVYMLKQRCEDDFRALFVFRKDSYTHRWAVLSQGRRCALAEANPSVRRAPLRGRAGGTGSQHRRAIGRGGVEHRMKIPGQATQWVPSG